MRSLRRGAAGPRVAADPRVAAGRGARRRGGVLLAGLVTGLLGSAGLVWQGTDAAFTASTGNAANSWSSGTVVVSDDDSGSALFSTGPLVPGDSGARCLAVTYTGSIAATVRLYGGSTSGALAPHLSLLVEQGAGAGNVGSASDCTGFAGTTIWSGTLAAFAASATSFGTGIGTFAPSGSGQVQVYRLTWTLDGATPDAAQGAAATASFVWEAQS